MLLVEHTDFKIGMHCATFSCLYSMKHRQRPVLSDRQTDRHKHSHYSAWGINLSPSKSPHQISTLIDPRHVS